LRVPGARSLLTTAVMASHKVISEEEMMSKVPELREKFLTLRQDVITSGGYDERDIERVRKNDTYLFCFVRSFGETGDLSKPLEMLDTVLSFRKKIEINDLTHDSFPKEFEERRFIYWNGTDIENRKIMLVKVALHKKGVQMDEVKRFICWQLEQYHKENLGGKRMVLIFDFTSAGIMNMDLDLVRFIITCLSTYFPGILGYILLFEMPWLLSSAWKIIRSWLTEEQKSKILLVKKADMPKYIEKSQLEEHMITAQ
jgi:hypothetical protein